MNTPLTSTNHSPGQNKLYIHLLNSFHIPTEYHSKLERYFILYWEGGYTRSQPFPGIIVRDNINYLTIYQDTYPSNLPPRVRLSFRKLEWMEHGFVIIRPVE